MSVTQASGRQISKAGLLLSAVAGLWMLLAPLLGHMGPPWPCAIVGAVVLASLGMIWTRPERRRAWSLVVIILSMSILLIGMRGVLPGILGIAGGLLIMEWSEKSEPET